MRPNEVRRKLRDGGNIVNGWLGIPNSFSAEVMAHASFDSVTVDMQHGMVDFQAAIGMLQAISTREVTPLARVPWNDPTPIMKILDAGAYGVICPMVNSAEECERFVGACRYAPGGYRSYGPARALMYSGNDYGAKANEEILTFAMIETREALANLDEILEVVGLDAVYVGPSDLSISLGYAPQANPDIPDVVGAIEKICADANAAGIYPGIHCADGAMVKRMFEIGFRFATISNDARMLSVAAAAEIAVARG